MALPERISVRADAETAAYLNAVSCDLGLAETLGLRRASMRELGFSRALTRQRFSAAIQNLPIVPVYAVLHFVAYHSSLLRPGECVEFWTGKSDRVFTLSRRDVFDHYDDDVITVTAVKWDDTEKVDLDRVLVTAENYQTVAI